jgi:hypothetical protein
MMNMKKLAHVLRAIGSVTEEKKLVVIGSTSVLLNAKNIPAEMLMSQEVDAFAPDTKDEEMFHDLVDGSLGAGSMFYRTFGYYGDGVSSKTARMPTDWQSRARQVAVAGVEGIQILVPDINDIALSKMIAWREKDQDWLKAGVRSLILKPRAMRERIAMLPPVETQQSEILRRMDSVAAYATT